jgi:tetrahydromethanopterin S-methyltransferase subunit F
MIDLLQTIDTGLQIGFFLAAILLPILLVFRWFQ